MPSPYLESVRRDIRLRGYSLYTEKTYLTWIRRYIYFIDKRHPQEAGTSEVKAFLTSFAVERRVAVITQKVALNALVFLYRKVLQQDLGELGFSLAKRCQYDTIYTHGIGQHYAGTESPLDHL